MLFRKYQIVVFRDDKGVCTKFGLRGLTPLFFFLLIGALAAGNVYLFRYYEGHLSMQNRLQEAEKTVEEQKSQLLSLAGKFQNIEKDLSRIRDFDSKMRVMVNLDGETAETVTSVGGPESKEFSEGYLPIYRQELLARKMHNFLYQLKTEVRLEEIRQQELVQSIRSSKEVLAATPSIWPTSGWVSSPFGRRTSPFTGKREFHKGIDISGRTGTPIYAPAKGTVIFAGVDGGYGKSIMVDHGRGIVTRYAHLHRLNVKKGQSVSRGEQIAQLGNTGRSTGPHLHYEVQLNGVCVNPKRYILN